MNTKMKPQNTVSRTAILILVISVFLCLSVAGCTPSETANPTVQPTIEPTATLPAPKKVALIFSYEQDFWATLDEDNGVIEGLATLGYVEGENLEIIRLYMNTKTVNKTPEQMEAVAVEMIDQIKDTGADLLILVDDNALQHVGSKLLDSDLPIVFAGINGFPTDAEYGWLTDSSKGPLADSMERPGHNITGVLERISFTAGFELLQKILPQSQTALFVSDNSAVTNLLMSGAGGTEELETVSLQVVEQVYTDEFEALKSTILEYQDQVDATVLFLPWTIEDANGDHVPQDQVVRWFLQNSSRPSIGFLDILVEEGYLCGVVVDMNRQGFYAGLLGGRILDGESPAEMPIIDPVANRILINLARADQLGIEIPFAILQDADGVFQEMTAYPEYQMSK